MLSYQGIDTGLHSVKEDDDKQVNQQPGDEDIKEDNTFDKMKILQKGLWFWNEYLFGQYQVSKSLMNLLVYIPRNVLL